MKQLEKVKTGITGLDDMLRGGLISGRPYLLTGSPGSGKTILGMHFLMEGVNNHEKGLYISLEEASEELSQNMAALGWDVDAIKIIDTYQEIGSDKWMIKSDTVLSTPELSLDNLLKVMRDRIQTYKPKRVVIDSLTSIRMLYKSDYDMRRALLLMMNFFFRSNVTAILTSTGGPDDVMEESVASGVLKLYRIENKGELMHGIRIEKLRGSDFDRHLRPIKITSKGIEVFQNESLIR